MVPEQAYAECRRLTRRYARSFYFASHALPPEKRRGAYAVYAFCRIADNLFDARLPGTGPPGDLEVLRRNLAAVYDPAATVTGTYAALRDTVVRFDIPPEYFHQLLRGVEMDLHPALYATFDELREYCYHVASVVGLIMTRVLGAAGDGAAHAAVDLGIAMQLTNILRDVAEDRAMNRRYLPTEDLERFGYDAEMLAQGRVNERFVRLMQFEIERARRFYRSAERGMPLLPDDGSRFCVILMSRVYEGILDAIEAAGYDVFTRRAVVPLSGKLAIAARAGLQKRRARHHRGTMRVPVGGTTHHDSPN